MSRSKLRDFASIDIIMSSLASVDFSLKNEPTGTEFRQRRGQALGC